MPGAWEGNRRLVKKFILYYFHALIVVIVTPFQVSDRLKKHHYHKHQYILHIVIFSEITYNNENNI